MNRLLTGMIQVIQEVDTNTGQPLCNEQSCPTMSAGRYVLLLPSKPPLCTVTKHPPLASHTLGSRTDDLPKFLPHLTLSVFNDGLLARFMTRMSSPPTLQQLLLPPPTFQVTWDPTLQAQPPRSLHLQATNHSPLSPDRTIGSANPPDSLPTITRM